MPKPILLNGPPTSGKSTLAARFDAFLRTVSPRDRTRWIDVVEGDIDATLERLVRAIDDAAS